MSDENNQHAENNSNKGSWFGSCQCRGVRYFFVLSGFLGMCIVYSLRGNMSIAIVAMVNNTAVYGEDQKKNSECPNPVLPRIFNLTDGANIIHKDGQFAWSPTLQGVIVGSFYYGYSAFQIPGGRLAEVYDSKWIFGIGTGLSALLSLLIPVAAHCHTALLIVIRTLQGVSQGVTLPAMYTLMGHWAPDSEKTLIESSIMSGINIGTVVGIPLAAELCHSNLFGGWPSAFYVIGLIGCGWFFLWIVTVTETPQRCACITQAEVDFISSNQAVDQSDKLPPIPWLQILTFGPYWAITFAQVVGDWMFFLILNDLPTFYSTILHFNIEQNGLLSSFPFLLQSIVGCLVGYLSDVFIRRNIFSPSLTRKICNTIGCVGSAMGLVVCCVAGCNVLAHTSAFTFTMAIGGFFYSSYMVALLDLSPEYAGTLVGIANTLSNLTGFLTPLLVGALTDENQTLARWRIVFIITIVLLLLSTVVYDVYSTSEKQDWEAQHHKERCARYRERISSLACWRRRTD